jgi:hypothetical protein|tara:strand:+ start:2909 stop:4825 length:1917 start_codon:yes stop_codon:yes gene_type:complete
MSTNVNMKINADVKGAVKNIDKVGDAIEDTGEKSVATSADVSQMGNTLDGVAGGAITKFRGLTGALGGVTKGFKTMKGAIISTGLGVLVLAIAAIIQAFRSSEEGQNMWAKTLGVISVVAGNFTDLLSDLGLKLIEIFTSPLKTFKNFKESLKQNITDKIDSLLENVGLMGTAFKKLFTGDFTGAAKDASSAIIGINRAINPVVIAGEALANGVDNIFTGIKSIGEETAKEMKLMAGIADDRAKAEVIERELITERAEVNRKRAELLNKVADKTNFTTKERIGFLKEAGRIEDEITAKEMKAATLRRDAIILENTLSASDKDALKEEEEAKAALIRLEAAKLTKAKLVTAQITGLLKAEQAERQKIIDKKIADKKIDDDIKAADLVADEARLEKIKKITELEVLVGLDKIAKDRELAIAELELLNATESDKNKVIEFYSQKEKDFKKDAALDVAKTQEETAAQNRAQMFETLDAVIEVAGAETKVGKALSLVKQGIRIKEQIEQAKATLVEMGLLSAKATADIAGGAASTASAGLPINIPLLIAFAGQAAGIIMSVKSAVNTAKGMAGKMGGGGGGGSSATMPSIPAAFNIVGQNSQNQLAEALSGQDKIPLRAYVTSGDISTAQSLDRSIITNASIG